MQLAAILPAALFLSVPGLRAQDISTPLHAQFAYVANLGGGGQSNNAFDDFTSITGGTGNTAGSVVTFQGGLGASVNGGSGNNAGGRNTVVIGGQNVTDNNDNWIAPKPPFP